MGGLYAYERPEGWMRFRAVYCIGGRSPLYIRANYFDFVHICEFSKILQEDTKEAPTAAIALANLLRELRGQDMRPIPEEKIKAVIGGLRPIYRQN